VLNDANDQMKILIMETATDLMLYFYHATRIIIPMNSKYTAALIDLAMQIVLNR